MFDREEAVKKAKALVEQMTLGEAASQLRYDSPAIERLGIPAYNWWNEALHGVARAGVATSYPQAIGMAASFDPDLIERLGDVSATEGRAKYNMCAKENDRDIYKGLTFWSPNINIFRDPRWGRGHETYGEDPFLTSRLGVAYINGLQGQGPVMKSAACAKHFAVHSGPEAQRHCFNAVASPKDMEETYLPAFEAAVKEADVESVMGAYNRTNGEVCCGSKTLLVDLLREKWKFQGHIVSDCWAIRDFHEHHMVTDTLEESAALALKMGCDLNCGNVYIYMMKAYQQGLVTEEQIRTAAVHLFTTRYLLGIMDGSEFDGIAYDAIECNAHLKIAEEATQKACVLLKNNGILPLDRDRIKNIAVVGPNANSRAALIGNYYGTSSTYITVLEGIQQEVGDAARVYYAEGCHICQDRVEILAQADDRLAEAKAVAELSDIVIAVVGLDESLEGEEGDDGNQAASGDKNDLLLPASQQKMLEAVLATGKPVVICLMAGSSIDLGTAGEKAAAVLLPWYPGARGGKTVADILFGKVSPSGKLPVTFYHNEALQEMPPFTDYAMRGRTYRYYNGDPIYPFGFGLTYGDAFVLSADVKEESGTLVVEAIVTNAGKADTQDVVQVYCQNEASDYAPVHARLCAFQRIFCPIGQKVNVTLRIPKDSFLVVNEEGKRMMDGKPVLYVGMGQPDARTSALTGHNAVKLHCEGLV